MFYVRSNILLGLYFEPKGLKKLLKHDILSLWVEITPKDHIATIIEILLDEVEHSDEVDVVSVVVRLFDGIEEDEDIKGLGKDLLFYVFGEFKINLSVGGL